MRKIRVYELAKEAGIESKDLTAKLIDLGFNVKAYNSTLDEETAQKVRVELGIVKTEIKETRIRSEKGGTTIIRRRAKVVPVVKAAPVEPEVEEVAAAAESVTEESIPAEPVATEEAAPEVVASTQVDVEAAETPVPEDTVPPVEAAAEAEGKPEEVSVTKAETKTQGQPLKNGYARIIGQTKVPIPAQDRAPRRPPKPFKKPRPAAGAKPSGTPTPGAPPADAAKKGKKAKRIVRFDTTQQPRAGGKGRTKQGGEVDARDAALLGARVSSKVKVGRGPRSRKRKQRYSSGPVEVSTVEMKASKRKVTVGEFVSVGDLAHALSVKSNELIGKLMGMGVMATVNQAIDFDTAAFIASDFGYEVEVMQTKEHSIVNLQEEETGGVQMSRPPVITVMGHVDHGKTSILDAIRDTDVAEGEAGGITQHIGAHYVRSPQGDMVFLDTPGHAAFTEMRSRGAQITDVVVLVVAADDGVMDQTREAINHAKAAEVPIIVAVNKIDKENADAMRVMSELAEYDLIPEEWGGNTIFVKTSVKTKEGIDDLVENILLQTEILELTADPARKAYGHVVEAQLHKGRGPVATVLIQQGTLRVGDNFVVGDFSGRVRSLRDDKGQSLTEAGPAVPVEVQGLSGVPMSGDEFLVVKDEKMAKSVSQERQAKKREVELASGTKISLDNLFEALQEGQMKEIRILLRSDVQGTLEAFGAAVEKLATEAIKVKILHSGTGTITESDVLLAAASNAFIIGFNVRPSAKVLALAEKDHVDMRTYDVIYHALEDIEKAMAGLLDPIFVEEVIGNAEVRETFTVPKAGTIAGTMVVSGHIERKAGVRLVRDGVVVYTGRISSLRRFKDDVKEVQNGYECGIGLENYNDIKIGDLIEAYIMNEVAATL
ncbi:MAG: translation initiation factor IF-2 [Desulfobulbaceae bacterium]|jgi:translation initiation factor IF-2|nr:translation initiation factor IF-2 [Desulfobulbaceae bacterium]